MNDLEELKNLLFGAEKQVLDSITERVQKPETRAVDVADVLPEAVRLSHRQGQQLVATLRAPVSQCLQESIRDEPKEYADALYPVMGPAIRKAIMNALRSFAQQINETI
ncbi:MAG: OmpA family protein, partial [Gammaproteobacteria bacterium]|nr:OmpA family protein [Gammaproteobacteria bacterium]